MSFAVLLLLSQLRGPAPAPVPMFRPVSAAGSDVLLVPESQRSLGRLIIGLQPEPHFAILAPIAARSGFALTDPRFLRLRERLFGLSFELLHGRILQSAPAHVRFFIAVPEKGPATGASGKEEALFQSYLRTRVGWSKETIERRVHFFHIPGVLNYPRDMAEPLGRDPKGRLVLGIGSDHHPLYFESLDRLVQAYPADFRRIIFPDVNAEGGDLSLVLLPDRGIGLLVGYHRILRYAAIRHGDVSKGAPVDPSLIEEARTAFRKAFFDREVIILGEAELRGSAAESQELFHADMVVNVLLGRNGPVAFVPSYAEGPVDSIFQTSLSADVRNRAQGVYDRAARQLAARGYRVVRIPFRDHPDRTPVQTGAFIDPATDQQTVLLGKYPYHLDVAGGERNRQRDLQTALDAMEAAIQRWRTNPSGAEWKRLFASLDGLSESMAAAAAGRNPHFELQASAYEAEGICVIPVPIYPTGEGGLHCLLLN